MNRQVIVKALLAACVLVCILTAGCTTASTPAAGDQPSTPEDMETVVEANNCFAWDLYHVLSDEGGNESANMFISPHSISTALALTYEGAKGETADEIRSVGRRFQA